jgi:hypothetical protein
MMINLEDCDQIRPSIDGAIPGQSAASDVNDQDVAFAFQIELSGKILKLLYSPSESLSCVSPLEVVPEAGCLGQMA